MLGTWEARPNTPAADSLLLRKRWGAAWPWCSTSTRLKGFASFENAWDWFQQSARHCSYFCAYSSERPGRSFSVVPSWHGCLTEPPLVESVCPQKTFPLTIALLRCCAPDSSLLKGAVFHSDFFVVVVFASIQWVCDIFRWAFPSHLPTLIRALRCTPVSTCLNFRGCEPAQRTCIVKCAPTPSPTSICLGPNDSGSRKLRRQMTPWSRTLRSLQDLFGSMTWLNTPSADPVLQ